jgi:O-antigen ligase
MLPRLAWATILCWIVAVPLVVSPHGKEAFRVPKDLLFLGEGIVLIALAIAIAIGSRVGPAVESMRRHPVVLIAAGIVLWTGVTTLTSTNRVLSETGLLWIVAAAAIAIAITALAQSKSLPALYWALIPAAINAVIFLLQRFRIWSPMQFDPTTPAHFRFTALIGNPDDVGSFLVAPMIVTLSLIVADVRSRRVSVPLALLLAAALLTGPITSIVATVAGAMALGVIRSKRSGIVTIIVLAVLIPLFAFTYEPLWTRVLYIRRAVSAGDYAAAFSGRVTPFSAAILMWRDHPIFGVGPNCFAWQYFPYKLEAERRNPRLIAAYAHAFNFSEVHNDHLQTLAETGIPGYALFLAAIWILGRCSRRDATAGDESPERRLSRTACVPLAVSLFVLCLAHFPLHLASATTMYLYIGMLCLGWSVPLAAPLERRERSLAVARFATTAVVAIAATYALYELCYEPYVCNRRKREIETVTARTLTATNQMLAAQRARRTLEMLAECAEELRTDVDFYMMAAANDRILGAPAEAETMYRRALDFDRRPELYYGLGSVQLEQGKTREAVANFVKAVTFNPDMMNDIPGAVRVQVAAIVQRNFPYLGVKQ